MRYLPMVMGVSFIVVVKIIKNQTCAEQNGPSRGEAKLACPYAEGPFLSIQHAIHEEPQAGLLATAGAKSTEGEKSPSREMTGENAVDGLDWQPLCRGCFALIRLSNSG
jgi:hypothetical protein